MKKRIAVVLSVFMLLTLVGCGTGTGNDIKIGADFEMTGGNATFGQSTVNGIKLAFKEINAKGGVLGKQLTLDVADNKSDPGESTLAATKLISQDKVTAVLGCVASSDTLAAEPVATANKTPLLSSLSTNTKVTVDPATGKVRPYIFRACFIDPFQGEVAANFATTTLKAKKAAVFIDQKSDYSQGLAEVFIDVFKKNGGTITTTEKYVAGDKDFRATLTRISGTEPDVIFVPGYYQEVGLMVKQAREAGINVPFVGGDGWDSADLVKIAGAEPLNKTYFVNHVATDDPALKEFVEKYKKEYKGEEPDALAILGYDSANIMAEAIKNAGSTDKEKIRTALENIKNFPAISGTVTIDPKTHNPIKSAVILEMVNGKKTFKEKIAPK